VLILGAGGVARAALRTLIINGFKDITIANRSESRAKGLADEFLFSDGISIDAIGTDHDSLSDISRSASLIVNCTSVGMKGDLQRISLLKSSDISKDSFVYDMVYNPIKTPLMDNANEAGAKVSNGLSMLIHQGAESFKLWTGIEPDFGIMLKAAEEALIMNQNQ
jgi:shikimate dehydrogenase